MPVVAPGAMPSSYRCDKARRAEWTKAVREGREEQLRIENWMKAQDAPAPAGRPEVTSATDKPNDGGVPAAGAAGRRAPAARPPSSRRPARPGAACSASTAPATPPASAAWSAGAAGRAGAPRPYGGYFDEVDDALEEAYPGFDDAIEKVVVDRGELTLHITPGADRRGLPGDARRRGAALRAVLVGVRRGLPRRRRAPAARRLPPDLDDLPAPGPAGGRGHRRGPAPAERDQPSTRPPTGRSGRRTTCSASSSTATPT